ncbi:AraC family transcriptional regulator [Mucilaginibacter sp.]|uniref:helix-turn-helix domain-containing protein n=1 Tax=Mucilaginibacter sp. TaxID=1882438 RepID=UPI0026093A16|nr:AraC family transcriptional regulator [Mucilaginibacter sp.]MDB4926452.1 hypothetical protein [Mucilaginibacter sp.]
MMLYKEFLPIPELRDRIECYWKFFVGPDISQPLLHVFPPDGCCNLLFVKSPYKSFILFSGPSTIVKEINIFPDTIFFGIRLKPGYSGWLYPADVAELKDKSINLTSTEISTWQANFLSQLHWEFDDVSFFDNTLLILKSVKPVVIDERVAKAIKLISEHEGNISSKQIASSVCMSPRNLERVFLRSTGVKVKQFSQLRRLRKAIIDMCVEKKGRNEMIVERGYTDPAHFYKSFRNISNYPLDKFQQHLRLIENQLI